MLGIHHPWEPALPLPGLVLIPRLSSWPLTPLVPTSLPSTHLPFTRTHPTPQPSQSGGRPREQAIQCSDQDHQGQIDPVGHPALVCLLLSSSGRTVIHAKVRSPRASLLFSGHVAGLCKSEPVLGRRANLRRAAETGMEQEESRGKHSQDLQSLSFLFGVALDKPLTVLSPSDSCCHIRPEMQSSQGRQSTSGCPVLRTRSQQMEGPKTHSTTPGLLPHSQNVVL